MRKVTHILYTELAYGVVHQDGNILYSHSYIPVRPAALVWPVLVTFVLKGDNNKYIKTFTDKLIHFYHNSQASV